MQGQMRADVGLELVQVGRLPLRKKKKITNTKGDVQVRELEA